MVARNAGHLIFMSSIAAHEAYAGGAVRCRTLPAVLPSGCGLRGCSWPCSTGAAGCRRQADTRSPCTIRPGCLAPGVHRHQARHRCCGHLGCGGQGQAAGAGCRAVGALQRLCSIATMLPLPGNPGCPHPSHAAPPPLLPPISAARPGGYQHPGHLHQPRRREDRVQVCVWVGGWVDGCCSRSAAPRWGWAQGGGGGELGFAAMQLHASRPALRSHPPPTHPSRLPSLPPNTLRQRGAVQGRRGQGGRRVPGHPPAAGCGCGAQGGQGQEAVEAQAPPRSRPTWVSCAAH